METLIIGLAITLLPVAAFGWDDEYIDRHNQAAYSRQILEELRYQQAWREYREVMEEYDERFPPGSQERLAEEHYFRTPRPPTR